MKKVHLKGSWIIKASLDDVYGIITDFENMPKNFPKVAHSVNILERDGDSLHIKAKACPAKVLFQIMFQILEPRVMKK
jgi:hypothetical protein